MPACGRDVGTKGNHRVILSGQIARRVFYRFSPAGAERIRPSAHSPVQTYPTPKKYTAALKLRTNHADKQIKVFISLYRNRQGREEMKYIFASLVIPSVQILFMLAFTVCALSIGAASLKGRLEPKKYRTEFRAPFAGE